MIKKKLIQIHFIVNIMRTLNLNDKLSKDVMYLKYRMMSLNLMLM